MPTSVFAASADWGAIGSAGVSALPQRIQRAAAELAREMLRPDRGEVPLPPDPLALPAGFDPSGTAAGPARTNGHPAGSSIANVVAAAGTSDAARQYKEWSGEIKRWSGE